MTGDTFQIRFRLFRSLETHFRQVEITYHSDKLIRFKITGGKKPIEMGKHLYRKTNQWKLHRPDFQPTHKFDSKQAAEVIMHMEEAINEYLKSNYIQ